MSDQEYTTAVIVAVPATDDPVHAVVAEDAHITLFFLGEAAQVPDVDIVEIRDSLEELSSHLHPFPAKVSGTALLGDDQANVLLVESDPLVKIRELVESIPAVSTALAVTADKQYPTWIPHLTMSYPGDDGMDIPVSNKPVDSFVVSGLELWLGGEKIAFPFAKAVPQPIFTEEPQVVSAGLTAAVGKFDPSLHPRGADGRFIEKFGIIKFLRPEGTWAYGKVEGIEKDDTGTVKVTVTPSTLSGAKLSGEPKELLPKQIYRAPKAKAHLTTTAPGAQKIGGQGGSNPGGLYAIPKLLTQGDSMESGATEKFYVKQPKSKSHGANEALANHLYEEAGVPVPEVDFASHADGQIYSKIVDGQQDMAAQLNNPEWADQVRRNFAVDAWLGNRDVFGMTYDNILTDANGTPWRIDNGGALLYRAMGEKKTDFGGKVTELDGFRTGKKAKIFGPGMTKIQELDGAQRVLAILPQRIEEMVAEAGLPKSLADTLKARRAYIADYYGLDLPEASKPAGAQEGTSAPLVDAADLAKHNGKSREWFKAQLHQAALLLSTGDTVEISATTGTGATDQLKYGVDHFGQPLSGLGAQAQLLGWQQTYGAGAVVLFKKAKGSDYPRPAHGSKLKASDLSVQNWQRGDKLSSPASGITWTVKGANPANGAVLLENPSGNTMLLDTHGKDGNFTWEVQRWDPPAVETPAEQVDDELTSFTLKPETGKYEAAQPSQEDSKAAVDTPAPNTQYPFPPVTIAPPKEKTGQAAGAEAAIKADLDQPLPTGNGTPEPKKTSAKSGEKKMLIGDGTEATPGVELVSKKDGKTYTFVKPKGQYAVVTDPNGEDPEKQLLKLASTMTQPGQLPTGELELPKTATGEVPALGMMAKAKDGWAGEITLISPDGKFVFITDANGTRKRKSTGTVSITGGTPAVADAPKKAPGPIKDYGSAPSGAWTGPQKVTAHLWAPATAQDKGEAHLAISADDMVHVGYADGTSGLEPYSSQPLDSLATNAQGMITVHGFIEGYLGPIDSKQLAQALSNNSAEDSEFGTQLIFSAVWNGVIFQTNGMTGPNGGLVLFDGDDPNDYAMELPPEGGQLIQLVDKKTGVLPSWDAVTSPQADDGHWNTTPTVLYGDEAKTVAEWKGQIHEGAWISLDGKNWLEVTSVAPISGQLIVKDPNGAQSVVPTNSTSTWVIKAPTMKDGDSQPAEAAWTPEVIPAIDVTGQPEPEFEGYTPQEGDKILSYSPASGDKYFYVQKPGDKHWRSLSNGEASDYWAVYAQDLPTNLGAEFGNNYAMEWPPEEGGPADASAPAKKKVTELVAGDVIDTADGVEIVSTADGTGTFTTLGGAESVTLPGSWDLDILGNAYDGPVDMPVQLAIPLLQPGNTLDVAEGVQLTVLSFPSLMDDGSFRFAVMTNGNPNDLELVSSANFGENVSVPVFLGAWSSHSDMGVDTAQVNALFDAAAHLNNPKPTDHHAEMTNAGIPFGTAGYPIFFDSGSQMYFRSGPTGGVENWSVNTGKWETYSATASTAGLAKVWDGVPFTGDLDIPAGADLSLFGVETATYKPKPGEAVAITVMPTGASALAVSPSGSFEDGQQVHTVIVVNGQVKLSDKTYAAESLKMGDATVTVIHDPFAENEQPQLTHHEGDLPQVLADAFESKGGYEPKPGATYFVVVDKNTGFPGVYEKNDEGKFVAVQGDGKLGATSWSMQEVVTSFSPDDWDTFTWTNGGGAKKPVPGLPSGYAPFTPGEGQSVLKVTTPAGKQTVLVQQHPGAGWYVMDADGTINESSDAVKSDYVVQKYLSGSGNAKAGTKYELLHPVAPGAEPTGQPGDLPNFKGYQVKPGEKVFKLGDPSDPDPWFYVQSEPGGTWHKVIWDTPGDGYLAMPGESSLSTVSDADIKKWLSEGDDGYQMVWEGTAAPSVDTAPEETDAPSFNGYTPKPGDVVISFNPEDGQKTYYVSQNGSPTYFPIQFNGTVGQGSGVAEDQLANYAGIEPEWPVDTSATPGFQGYVPQAGESVYEESDGTFWVLTPADGKYHAVQATGELGKSGLDQKDWTTSNVTGDMKQVWPPKAAGATPAFNGYTPQAGEKVAEFTTFGNKVYYVQKPGEENWSTVNADTGTLVNQSMVPATSVQAVLDNGKATMVWPVDTPIDPADQGIVAKGYQTKKTDNVIELEYALGTKMTLVYSPDHAQWLQVLTDGTLGSPTDDGYTQDTVDWALGSDSVTVHVLQGLPKGSPASAEPKPLAEDKYAGVSSVTLLTKGSYFFEGYTPSEDVTQKINALGALANGNSLYVVDNSHKGPGYESTVWVRSSTGQRYRISKHGSMAPDVSLTSDDAWETFVSGGNPPSPVYKLKVGAPAAAPVVKKPYNGPKISGWNIAGVPNPETFNAISSASEGAGAKAGSFIYMTANGTGLMMQLGKDWDGGENFYPQKVWAVNSNVIVEDPAISYTDMDEVTPWKFVEGNQFYISADPVAGTPTSTAPSVPSFKGYTPKPGEKVAATSNGASTYVQPTAGGPWFAVDDDGTMGTYSVPDSTLQAWMSTGGGDSDAFNQVWPLEAPKPSVPVSAPAPKPSYPGALAPSQEDINAWGGSLTKDGHIPTAGMFVTGKGPMSGKIISVSKDKTKAVVLTSEGKKTTRLIEALKTDKSANYSAYAAPATLKDIPGGMPLAVDTPAEVLAKTVKDGKFRAIVTDHPGVSGGSITVTKATGPSGKAYNRVHLTLTNDQRTQLIGMLSGTGEKGDWATSSKMSEAVAIGDELPMRQSSQANPDGSVRWKVDPSIKPPTHTVVKVEDDPSGSGIKIVTMKDKNTGETITSRFHPGKSLTTYAWDPNKPKMMTAGAFVLSEAAKGMGWTHVTDGGISSASGGAADAKLHNEPGSTVTKSVFHDKNSSWKTLRNVSDDGVVIEVIDPKGSNNWSTTGTTVISIPEGLDEKSLGAAFSKLGIDYSPMTQEGAKNAARGLLRNLLSLDMNDVDSVGGWTDEKLFTKAGQTIGISDLGWTDVLVGVDESTGKTSFFWSDRARNALAAKTKYNLVYRSATSADADAIVSTVKYGSANSVLKRTTGMIDAPTGKGTGASWHTDLTNKAGHGSYVSAGTQHSLPSGNPQAGYKTVGMMIYHRPEAVLGRIMDYRTSQGDAFGKGQGNGADHMAHATKSSSITDFFMGGGLPTEAVGFIAVSSAHARNQAIEKLKADGYDQINGRPIEEIVILMDDAKKLKPSDLPPVTLPLNARPILDLPVSYDAPSAEVAA